MRITSSSIPNQTGQSGALTPPQGTGKIPRPQQLLAARDSYTENAASAQVIDAEYVEFHHPDDKVFIQERHKLDLSLGPEVIGQASTGTAKTNSNTAIGQYQLKRHSAPPPGTYINIFA